jgi:phenylpropionate dioxygenase-like ring-hydroxylating dioxygenase large terminal subunit
VASRFKTTEADLESAQPLGEGWVRVASAADVPAGTIHATRIDGKPLAIVRTATGFVAFPDVCLHYKIPLSEGRIEGDRLVCRWHQWEYDCEAGSVHSPESPYSSFLTFPVAEREGELFLNLQPRTRLERLPDPDDQCGACLAPPGKR